MEELQCQPLTSSRSHEITLFSGNEMEETSPFRSAQGLEAELSTPKTDLVYFAPVQSNSNLQLIPLKTSGSVERAKNHQLAIAAAAVPYFLLPHQSISLSRLPVSSRRKKGALFR
jgi:hypothetical protein